jgi:hypothetical protein
MSSGRIALGLQQEKIREPRRVPDALVDGQPLLKLRTAFRMLALGH